MMMMMMMMIMINVQERRDSGDGRRARETQHNTTETVRAAPRAPETVLTNAPAYALARKHSRETQPGLRAAHNRRRRHVTHTPARTPLTTAQPTTNRQTVSGGRRHETRHTGCSCGSGCRKTETRRVGHDPSQLTAGPRADRPVFRRDCSCCVIVCM